MDTGFLGEFQHTLDPKGRVILPSRFRDELAKGLVMTVGQDHCLTIYPVDVWRELAVRLRSLRSTDRRERAYARAMRSYAHPDEPDRQGRITIPARLREYAELTKDIAVVGQDTAVEVWDSARWERYRDAAVDTFAETDQPFDLGGF